ncbi:hypothetical protein [Paucihalobacter sp.]|uniref:hypothetical protein n=1 Tax=Paucihalobacter sp. TaxID=2850405 RepID=UPI003D16050D
MIDKQKLYSKIDDIIAEVDSAKNETEFNKEIKRRNKNLVSSQLDDNELLKTLSYLIAYSQNANSKRVELLLLSGNFDEAFEDFKIDEVVKLNPCVIADEHWHKISGIRQQSKIFHIVSLSRKIKNIGSFAEIINATYIPKKISSPQDIDDFWIGFDKLLKILKVHKIPFFQSTTSLLHLLLHLGYDCVKPDLVVMKVAKKLEIVEVVTGNNNLIKTVKTIQEYAIDRKIRPAIVDLYFLIYGGQKGAQKYVRRRF